MLGNLWGLDIKSGSPVDWGVVLSEGLTKLQAAKDPKDQPHRVVQRQDRVDHVISCDPTQAQHPAYL